jgi:hypothetical protein
MLRAARGNRITPKGHVGYPVYWYHISIRRGLINMPYKYDWIGLEAETFGLKLDRTVIRIYSAAYGALTSTFEKQREGLEDWSESDSGVSEGQYEDYITEEYMIQVRALTTMTFTLMETQLQGFLRANGAFLARHFPRDKEQYGSKSWLLRAIAEYRERYGIEIEALSGFATCREVVLARNSCVHAECEPKDDYMQQTDRRFLGNDGLLFLNQETLMFATENLKSFASALAEVTGGRIDAAKSRVHGTIARC